VALSVKSWQDVVKLLRLPMKFEIYVGGMIVFSWSLFNRTPNFCGIGGIMLRSATILAPFSPYVFSSP